MTGMWVQSLLREDSTRGGATKPTHHNCWARALEPMLCNEKPLQEKKEKPLQGETLTPKLESSPLLSTTRESSCAAMIAQPKIDE